MTKEERLKRIRKIVMPVVAAAALFLLWRALFPGPFTYAGTVEATEVDVSARVASVIARVEVAEGTEVRKGQALFRLACEDIGLAARLAESNYRRAESLFKSGSMPQAEYDRARFQRDDALLRQGWCRVASPVTGTVLYTYFEAGEMVAPGARMATVADLSRVWAVIYVAEPLLAKLKPGMKVEGRASGAGSARFPGAVSHIREKAEFTPKNVQTREERTRLVYGVKVEFDNPDRVLKPGMTVEVALPR
jgi:HlyD family secretion protein